MLSEGKSLRVCQTWGGLVACAVARWWFLAREATLCHAVVACACPQGGKAQWGREEERVWGELLLGGREEQDGLVAREGTQQPTNDCDFLLCFLSILEAFLNKTTVFLLHNFPVYLKAS